MLFINFLLSLKILKDMYCFFPAWHVFHQVYNGLPASWEQPELASRIEKCLEVRNELFRRHPNVNHNVQVTVTAGGDMLESLMVWHNIIVMIFFSTIVIMKMMIAMMICLVYKI